MENTKRQISMSEIENLIKEKVRKYGIGNKIDDSKISEIKEKIKNILQSEKKKTISEQGESAPEAEKETETAPATEPQKDVVDASPKTPENPNISVKTTENKERVEFERQKAELELKEKILQQKEIEISQKQRELEIKEKELSYKPEMPEVLKNVPPASIIIFSENELSASEENLSERKFRLADDPDRKVSLHDLWLEAGITTTYVSIVDLREIGKLVFDPYHGTARFDNAPEVPVEEKGMSDHFAMNQKDAFESQIPEAPMLDAVQPIKDVTMPIVNPGIESAKPQVEDFGINFQSMIEKIIKDELIKKNTFSL